MRQRYIFASINTIITVYINVGISGHTILTILINANATIDHIVGRGCKLMGENESFGRPWLPRIGELLIDIRGLCMQSMSKTVVIHHEMSLLHYFTSPDPIFI